MCGRVGSPKPKIAQRLKNHPQTNKYRIEQSAQVRPEPTMKEVGQRMQESNKRILISQQMKRCGKNNTKSIKLKTINIDQRTNNETHVPNAAWDHRPIPELHR